MKGVINLITPGLNHEWSNWNNYNSDLARWKRIQFISTESEQKLRNQFDFVASIIGAAVAAVAAIAAAVAAAAAAVAAAEGLQSHYRRLQFLHFKPLIDLSLWRSVEMWCARFLNGLNFESNLRRSAIVKDISIALSIVRLKQFETTHAQYRWEPMASSESWDSNPRQHDPETRMHQKSQGFKTSTSPHFFASKAFFPNLDVRQKNVWNIFSFQLFQALSSNLEQNVKEDSKFKQMLRNQNVDNLLRGGNPPPPSHCWKMSQTAKRGYLEDQRLHCYRLNSWASFKSWVKQH